MEPNCYKNKPANTKSLKQAISFLKTISEENRLKILCLLRKGEKCVCEIGQNLNLAQNLTSHHLKVLKDFGLVSSRQEGLKVISAINEKVMEKYIKLLNKFLKEG